jgi:hypothetical protein
MEAGMVAEADPMAAVGAASTVGAEVGFTAAEAEDSTVVAVDRIVEAVAAHIAVVEAADSAAA